MGEDITFFDGPRALILNMSYKVIFLHNIRPLESRLDNYSVTSNAHGSSESLVAGLIHGEETIM